MIPLHIDPPASASRRSEPGSARLREAAVQLEATFLAEMLGSAGLGAGRDSLGGGVGEQQFASLLVRAQAEAIVRAGGIGLAETIFQALMERDDDP